MDACVDPEVFDIVDGEMTFKGGAFGARAAVVYRNGWKDPQCEERRPAKKELVDCGHCGQTISLRARSEHGDCFPQHRSADDSGRCGVVELGSRCTGPVKARGWCNRHLQAWTKHGDPTHRSRRRPGEMLELVEAAAQSDTDECIITPCGSSRPSVRIGGPPMTAARAVYIKATGEDPGDRWVLHTCHRGDEGCINIRHLYLGDHAQNTRDMVDAERAASGGRNANVKLDEDAVRRMRRLYTAGECSQAELARMFQITPGTVSQIMSRRTWKHVS